LPADLLRCLLDDGEVGKQGVTVGDAEAGGTSQDALNGISASVVEFDERIHRAPHTQEALGAAEGQAA
jgi:hypothetical protein